MSLNEGGCAVCLQLSDELSTGDGNAEQVQPFRMRFVDAGRAATVRLSTRRDCLERFPARDRDRQLVRNACESCGGGGRRGAVA